MGPDGEPLGEAFGGASAPLRAVGGSLRELPAFVLAFACSYG